MLFAVSCPIAYLEHQLDTRGPELDYLDTGRAALLRPADGRRQGLIGFTFVSTPFTRTVTFRRFRARSATIL